MLLRYVKVPFLTCPISKYIAFLSYFKAQWCNKLNPHDPSIEVCMNISFICVRSLYYMKNASVREIKDILKTILSTEHYLSGHLFAEVVP